MNESFHSGRAAEPLGAYPHARRVGGLLFLSGLGPRVRGRRDIPGVTLDEQGRLVSYDFEVQCRACFDNVRHVLEQAGARWDQIVDVLVLLTDLRRDYETFNRVWAEYFGGPGQPAPARTTIEVARLPQGGSAPIAIELKVIAAVGS